MTVSALNPLVGPPQSAADFSGARPVTLVGASSGGAGTSTVVGRAAKMTAATAKTAHSTHGSHQRPTGWAAGRSWMRRERTRSLRETPRPAGVGGIPWGLLAWS